MYTRTHVRHIVLYVHHLCIHRYDVQYATAALDDKFATIDRNLFLYKQTRVRTSVDRDTIAIRATVFTINRIFIQTKGAVKAYTNRPGLRVFVDFVNKFSCLLCIRMVKYTRFIPPRIIKYE